MTQGSSQREAEERQVQTEELLRQDIERAGLAIKDEEWRQLRRDFTACRYGAGDIIFSNRHVADRWLFVTHGVVAAEQSTRSGDVLIARFFEPGHFCSNLTSAWSRELALDELIAITDVEGILIPDALFRHQFLRGAVFGEYLRVKCIETLLFDKDVLYAKTSNDTEVQYRFLEDKYVHVIDRTAQKDIARFIGLTPQGLNRFLRRRADRGGPLPDEPKDA